MSISTRREGQPRTVFVLGGGGNLGALQVGMLRALLEADVHPDAVVGASVGAINGAVLAFNPGLAGVDRLEDQWRPLRRSRVFPLRVSALAQGVLNGAHGLVAATGLRSVLADTGLTGTRLEDAPTGLYVVATDLGSSRPVVLSSGDTVEALLASAAIPRVFPPVEVDGRRLVDGAVQSAVPLAQALDLGAEETYVLPAHPGVAGKTTATVHYLPVPPVAARVRPYDFHSAGLLIESAYAGTRAWLAARSGSDLRELVGA